MIVLICLVISAKQYYLAKMEARVSLLKININANALPATGTILHFIISCIYEICMIKICVRYLKTKKAKEK